MSARAVHPSSDEIAAAVSGQLNVADAQRVRSHAAGCRKCGDRLCTEERTRERLELLAADAPQVNVVQQVLERIAAQKQEQPVLDESEPGSSRRASG